MPATVFISYSHKDEDWKDRLITHLGVLEEQNLLRTWNDRDLRAGELWLEGIQNEIDDARVAVLLISANSLTSKFICNQEVPRFLELWKQAGITIFPVIIKDCAWKKVPWLSQFQVRPRDGKPLALRGVRIDSELTAIAEEILDIVDGGLPVLPGLPEGIEHRNDAAFLPSLHQIPSPPADFTGRQEDLSVLKASLTAGGAAAIFGLQGMGGVGKTALALKLAEELETRYPDAQLFLDLKGVASQPLTAADAMAHVVRSFHPDVRLPQHEAEMAGLYRSILHGKRALLLMDNARNSEQVEPLIPPPGSLLLVTSRFRFTLPGLIVRDLHELSEDDARALLLSIAPRIGSAASEIAGLCSRLPLALRFAGRALAERPSLSPADYSRRLRAGKELDPVGSSLNVSYKLLSKHQQRLWRLLAAFPGTFDALAAAAVWDLETDPASDTLADLVRSSLMEWEGKDGRYRLHDLARNFADRRLKDVERDLARRRHAEHYLWVLRAANGLYEMGSESVIPGLRLLDTEWSNIVAGQLWSSQSIEEEASRICSDYPKAGGLLLDLRQHPRDRIHWLELALAAARNNHDREREGHHLGSLGLAYATLGEPRRAIELYEQTLTIDREIGDRRGEANALNNLGVAYADLGEHRRAIVLYEQALILDREIGNRRGEANALNNLGFAWTYLGEPQRALELCSEALAIDREIGDRRGEGNALNNLGAAYADLGDHQSAIELYEQALLIDREIGDRRGEGNALNNLGLAHAALGEPRRAIELHHQALAIEREIGHRRGEGQVLGNLGNAYTDLGQPQRAIEFHEQALAIDREIGDRRGEAADLGNLGISYKNLGENQRAIDLYEQQLVIAQEIGDQLGEANASWNLGREIEKAGDTRRAAALMQICVDYLHTVGDPDAEKFVAHIAAVRARITETPPND
jgi:tetratricopeptide (TPR) repeat protein